MALDSRQTTKSKCRIFHIGLDDREALVIQSIFRIEPKLNEKYVYGESEDGDPPDILFLNADDSETMVQWSSLVDEHPHIVPILVTDQPDEQGGNATVIERPLAFRKFMQILNAITSSQQSASVDASPEKPSLNVLVVDDSFPARQFMKMKLEEISADIANLTIDFAENGQQALDAANEKDYDLAFLDVVMPGMDGYEICQKIKNKSDTRVAMLTGQTMKADQARGRKAGCDHYVAKPPRDNEIRDVVQITSFTKPGAA